MSMDYIEKHKVNPAVSPFETAFEIISKPLPNIMMYLDFVKLKCDRMRTAMTMKAIIGN